MHRTAKTLKIRRGLQTKVANAVNEWKECKWPSARTEDSIRRYEMVDEGKKTRRLTYYWTCGSNCIICNMELRMRIRARMIEEDANRIDIVTFWDEMDGRL